MKAMAYKHDDQADILTYHSSQSHTPLRLMTLNFQHELIDLLPKWIYLRFQPLHNMIILFAASGNFSNTAVMGSNWLAG
jgi:hypothetical protein